MTDATLALGIDLGTTNCALSSVAIGDKSATPTPLAIPQTVAPGETMAEKLLPSFLYVSAEAERTGGAFALPWSASQEEVIGTYARKQGAATPADSSRQPRAALVQWRRPTL